MAHYDAHRNWRGYDGYEEPTYGARPLAAIVGYSATVESYVAEKVVPVPVRPDQMWPRSSTHIQTKQIDEYDNSPKLTHTNGSPRKAFHGANSPPTGHYPSNFGPHLVAPHDSPRSPKLTHTYGNGSPHDSPRKPFHGANNPSTGQYPVKYGGPHDSPRNNFRDKRGGFSGNDDDSSDEDDVECRDGVCYRKPKHGAGQGYDYDKEKKKGNGYAAGNNYPVQQYSSDHKPRKDLHRQASDGHKYYSTEKMPEGNNIYGSHSYNAPAPAHTKPTSDAYYDRFSYPANDNEHNNTNYTHSKSEPYAVPAPIKTRPDTGKSSPLSAVAHWTPFASSPRKGHQGKPEMISSTEAERRYGHAPPQSAPAADRSYRGTAIDCEEAARKYGGVFVK